MNNDRNKNKDEPEENKNPPVQKEQRSSAFNETRMRNEKSTSNPEEEADMEQERKDAMTERD